jgi:glyceraldehyde-3-phosphate dehydrogenase (NAD(P))
MKINKIRVGVNGYGVIGKRVADAGLPVTGVLIRRATDPWESDHGGIRNTIVPEAHIPSHQGPDA